MKQGRICKKYSIMTDNSDLSINVTVVTMISGPMPYIQLTAVQGL